MAFRDLNEFDLVEEVKLVKKCLVEPFDEYRKLFNELSAQGVGKDMLSTSFPETFAQSSFGWSLSKTQLISRYTKLNDWTIALLLSFHAFPEGAQDAVVSFFRLDDPSEPENSIFVDM